MRLLVGSLVGLLVGKSYHTRQKDGYSLPTNDLTNNRINWIWMSKKIGLYTCFYSNNQIFIGHYQKGKQASVRVLFKQNMSEFATLRDTFLKPLDMKNYRYFPSRILCQIYRLVKIYDLKMTKTYFKIEFLYDFRF